MRPSSLNLALAMLPPLLSIGCAAVGGQAARAAPVGRRGQVFDAQITVSGGTYEHDTDGSLKDDTGASFVGLIVEGSTRSGFGGGLSLEVMASKDDLFQNQATSSAQVTTVEFAPFFLYRMRAGERFRMPIRVGPWIHALTLEDQGSSDSLEWASFGLRAAAEPEFVVVQGNDLELSVFAGLSLAGGATRIQLDSTAGDETFDSSAGAFGFELGPRLRWSHFVAGVSYLHRGLSVDESDPENNVVVRGIDTTYDGLAFTFGGGF